MKGLRALFATLEEPGILADFRATGSHDPDILHSRKAALLSQAVVPKRAGLCALVLGGAATLTVVGAVAGVPLLCVGWWLLRRGARNVRAVEGAFTHYSSFPATSRRG